MATAAFKVAAVQASDPLAQGLGFGQIVNQTNVGAQALLNQDYLALGGANTTSLAKAAMVDAGVDAAGNCIAIGDRMNFVACLPQGAGEKGPHIVVVLGRQNTRHDRSGPGRSPISLAVRRTRRDIRCGPPRGCATPLLGG
jgi:hypothetical protein